jgi:hypothetical protein
MARLRDRGHHEIYTTKTEAVKRKNLLNQSARKGNINLVHSVKKLKGGRWAVLVRSKRKN